MAVHHLLPHPAARTGSYDATLNPTSTLIDPKLKATPVHAGRVAAFYVLVLLGPIASASLLWVLELRTGMLATVIVAAAMFAPMLATLVMQCMSGERLLRSVAAKLRFSRWMALAVVVPIGIALSAMVLGPLMPGASWDWGLTALLAQLSAVLSPEELAKAETRLQALPVHPAAPAAT